MMATSAAAKHNQAELQAGQQQGAVEMIRNIVRIFTERCRL